MKTPPVMLHPFAVPSRPAEEFVSIVAGDGCWVTDRDGRRFLDATAALWYCNVGHGRREIADAVHEQMQKLAGYHSFDVFTNPLADQLAERLRHLAPMPGSRVFFTSGGSEAIDTAIKLSRFAHHLRGEDQRTVILTREPSYHGVTYGAVTATGLPANRHGFGPLLPDVLRVPWDDLDAAAAAVSDGGRLAAIIAEPVIGAGGVLPASSGYLDGLRRICDVSGAFLIFDETITGFGRVGGWFAAEHYGVVPDAITFAKGVTSGYLPLGGVLLGPRLLESLDRHDEVLRHGTTYAGHPVCCAAALANLDIVEREDLTARATALGPTLGDALAADARSAGGTVRGLGFMQAVVLPPALDAIAVATAMRGQGVLMRAIPSENVVACSPPLIIDELQIALMASELEGVLLRLAG